MAVGTAPSYRRCDMVSNLLDCQGSDGLSSLHALLHVIPWVVHHGADRVRLHLFRRVRPQQRPQLVGVGNFRIKPLAGSHKYVIRLPKPTPHRASGRSRCTYGERTGSGPSGQSHCRVFMFCCAIPRFTINGLRRRRPVLDYDAQRKFGVWQDAFPHVPGEQCSRPCSSRMVLRRLVWRRHVRGANPRTG